MLSGASWTDGTDPWGIEMKRSIASFSVGQYYGTVPYVAGRLLFPFSSVPCSEPLEPSLIAGGRPGRCGSSSSRESPMGKQRPLGDVGEQILGLLRFMGV